ncbi:hypothetical protein R3P38DRAFT_3193041 [Favolaschia claudopus]|uniref:Zn(2)-C6 fungal-type domain-containing protein n=1 Tax=Favolaschia claudopus TaxID=2862362 RepID=A0AAW0BJF5_9AGAR
MPFRRENESHSDYTERLAKVTEADFTDMISTGEATTEEMGDWWAVQDGLRVAAAEKAKAKETARRLKMQMALAAVEKQRKEEERVKAEKEKERERKKKAAEKAAEKKKDKKRDRESSEEVEVEEITRCERCVQDNAKCERRVGGRASACARCAGKKLGCSFGPNNENKRQRTSEHGAPPASEPARGGPAMTELARVLETFSSHFVEHTVHRSQLTEDTNGHLADIAASLRGVATGVRRMEQRLAAIEVRMGEVWDRVRMTTVREESPGLEYVADTRGPVAPSEDDEEDEEEEDSESDAEEKKKKKTEESSSGSDSDSEEEEGPVHGPMEEPDALGEDEETEAGGSGTATGN